MEQSPSWESDRSLASQEIPRILWNSKAHYLSLSWSIPSKTNMALENSITLTVGSHTARSPGFKYTTLSCLTTARPPDVISYPQSATVFKIDPPEWTPLYRELRLYKTARKQSRDMYTNSTLWCCTSRELKNVAPQQIEPGSLRFISPLTWRSMQLQSHTPYSLWLMQVLKALLMVGSIPCMPRPPDTWLWWEDKRSLVRLYRTFRKASGHPTHVFHPQWWY
jgi:hypothetical protein